MFGRREAITIYKHKDGRCTTVSYHKNSDTFGIGLLRAMISDANWTEDDRRRLKLIKYPTSFCGISFWASVNLRAMPGEPWIVSKIAFHFKPEDDIDEKARTNVLDIDGLMRHQTR